MKKLKENKGFTLVELIVVIAILGILAGVAVPAYTGYISKAKESSDLQVLSSINTAAQGLVAASGSTLSSITVTTDTDGKITDVTTSPVVSGVLDLAAGSGNTLTLKSDTFKSGATWGIDSTTNVGTWSKKSGS